MKTCKTFRLFSRFASLVFLMSATLVLTNCGDSGLDTGPNKTAFNVGVQSASSSTKAHPQNQSFDVSASCPADQTLMGGGYQLVNNDNRNPTLVAIEATYPSSKLTWTVTARNPDTGQYTGDSDVMVIALAYCLTTPNYDIDTEVREGATFLAATNSPNEMDVRCSTGDGIVLSGGFKTSSLPPLPAEPGRREYSQYWGGLTGSGVIAFEPRLRDDSHSTMGWHLTQQYTPTLIPGAPATPMNTSIYAICARKSMNNSAVREVRTPGTLSFSNTGGNYSMESSCNQGEFSISGGYKFADPLGLGGYAQGPALVDSQLSLNSPHSLHGWGITGESNGGKVEGIAHCIAIPVI